MTEVQLDAIKSLATRYGSSLDHTDVVHDLDGTGICGLPPKWERSHMGMIRLSPGASLPMGGYQPR